jgi:hypothetical protein
MNPTQQTNPNDYKVVSFHNGEDFGFTPEMGCMYNGVPINGKLGGPGINAGETMVLPYHIAHQLALNLAKVAMTRQAPEVDPAGVPTGIPLWDDVKLQRIKTSYLTELYSEERAAPKSETEVLLAKLEEYKNLFTDEKISQLLKVAESTPTEPTASVVAPEKTATTLGYQDKAEVMAELDKRGIKHNKRSSKSELEKLLA